MFPLHPVEAAGTAPASRECEKRVSTYIVWRGSLGYKTPSDTVLYPHPFWYFHKRIRITFYERLSIRPMSFTVRATIKDGWLHYYAASAFAVVAVMFLPVFNEFLTNSTGNSNSTSTLSKPVSPPLLQGNIGCRYQTPFQQSYLYIVIPLFSNYNYTS